MNIILNFLFIVVLTVSLSAQTSDSLALPQTKQLLQFLQSLSGRTEKRLISGHQLNLSHPSASAYDSVVSPIFIKTGKYPGLVGVEYQRSAKGMMSSMAGSNSALYRHVRAGGIAAVMSSFTNPWTDSTSNDTTGRHRIAELLQPGTTANIKWMQRLDSVARGLQLLQDSGITVLYRPLHEMNATWFWWGSQSSQFPTKQVYSSLWIQMHNYFTNIKKLHNILWVYSPSARLSSMVSPAFRHDTAFYPGSDVVDIVGVDVYEDTLDIPSYQSLLSYGKPMVLCEFGPSISSVDTAFQYDYRTMLQQIKNKYPKIVYWMSWNDFSTSKGARFYGMTNQNHVAELLSDPWVIHLSDLTSMMTTAVQSPELRAPLRHAVVRNYPNPFNPVTTIHYTLPDAGAVSLTVYDGIGRIVSRTVNTYQAEGTYAVQFDASSLASGVYITELQCGASVEYARMMLIK
jgi:mannan endo-1,4-beta-mannosidase